MKNSLFSLWRPGIKSWLMAALIASQFACSANDDPVLQFKENSDLNPLGPVAPGDESLAPLDPRNPANWFSNGDVESGIEPWQSQGDGVTLQRSSEHSNSGEYSLLVEGRSSDWHGPVMPLLTTLPNGRYQAIVWVRLAEESESGEEIKLSLKTRVGDEASYIMVNSAEVAAGEWKRLSGTFELKGSERWDELALYLESPNETLSFYVDDLSMVSFNNLIVNGDIESGTEPWRTQGGPILNQVSDQYRSGQNSLFVSGRSANWTGPVMDLPTLAEGRVYGASVWVKLAANTPTARLNLTLKRTVAGLESEYLQLGTAEVTQFEWTEISGSFTHTPPAGELVEHLLYIESDMESATASFYVDDLELAISENAIANGDFESGTGGWFPLGNIVMERVRSTAQSGSYSLFVRNREQEWHGPATGLNLTPGIYDISCHFRLAEGMTNTVAKLTVKRVDAVEEAYIQVSTMNVTAGQWVELKGTYIFDPQGEVTEHHMYVHAHEPTAEYFIDACAVTAQ